MDLQLGSRNEDVRRLEHKLQTLGLYTGPADGVFGGGVESAVKQFQKSHGLQPDGIVGAETRTALFPDAVMPASTLQNRPLAERCLALTGSFETSSGFPECFSELAGDFDGEGISFGVLQWNLGQGTLQPLFLDMLEAYPQTIGEVFQDRLATFKRVLALPRQQQLSWALSIQSPDRRVVFEPWKGYFEALGRTASFQFVQMDYSKRLYAEAVALAQEYELITDRGMALMFDICVQNGSIGRDIGAQIREDYSKQSRYQSPLDEQVVRMQAIANRVAQSSRPEFVDDVRARKLTIANGTGVVHNLDYDLAEQFSIDLLPFARKRVRVGS
ncbi:MAG: peptidoglycan-binding protein [Acidobacteriaceae bacterium]|nr:peptidoglycan-binding protein [Acidobacteriaceae bacterium]MBV9502553.1 peptidoglycan-binding protein [Acidobacteriaceae bacterium]